MGAQAVGPELDVHDGCGVGGGEVVGTTTVRGPLADAETGDGTGDERAPVVLRAAGAGEGNR